MSNVEESLETQARIGALRCEGGPHSPTGGLLRRLADEIERLHAEVAAAKRDRAIAQAVSELPKLYGEFSYETNLAFVLNRRADELLEGK